MHELHKPEILKTRRCGSLTRTGSVHTAKFTGVSAWIRTEWDLILHSGVMKRFAHPYGFGASGFQHSIEDRHADRGFSALTAQATHRSRGPMIALYRPRSSHGDFREPPAPITDFFLPAQPSSDRKQSNMIVPPQWSMYCAIAQDRRHMR
jgi:hypothetical protein